MGAVDTVKLLVVAPNWLGDAVMALPALAAAGGDGVVVSVMTRPYPARVFDGAAGVDEVIVLGGSRAGRVRDQARAMRALGAGVAVVLPPSFSSALPAWLARVRERVGYPLDGRGWMFTDAPLLPPRGSEHLSQSYLRLVSRARQRIARPPRPAPSRGTLRVFDDDRREAGALLERFGVGGEYAAVVPGATFGPAKSWPRERFGETVRALAADLPVLLLGGAGERALCEGVAGDTPGVHNAAGSTSLGAFFALVSGAGVLVANDSGAGHVAGALGVPAVVLFGSTEPAWTRPLGDDVTVIRHRVHCAPCFRRDCPTQLECFHAIETDEVVAAARAGLAKKEVAQSPGGR